MRWPLEAGGKLTELSPKRLLTLAYGPGCILTCMRFRKATVARIGLGCLAGLPLASVAGAHEPVFSVGPETIFQAGVGVEVGLDFETAGRRQEYGLDYELIYGLTSKIALTLEVPQVVRQETDNGSESGVGDLVLRAKYRFWTRDRLNSSDKASLILGVKLPTGKHRGDAGLGSGSTDPLFGLSLGHESRTGYGFGTFRYLLRTHHDGFDLGDRILYDFAAGFRPWRRGYLETDFVFLLEYNGITTLRDRAGGSSLPTGGDLGWLGPTALISYRNLMTKFGVQALIYENLRGSQSGSDVRAVLSLEYHF